MSNSILIPVTSIPASNFTEALATNAKTAMNNLNGLTPVLSRAYLIRAIRVTAKENWGPQLNFFGTAAGNTTDPATNNFVGVWGFASGNQIGATGLYEYYIDGLAIPYRDEDYVGRAGQAPPQIHVVAMNISATAKSAGSDGSTKVTIWLEAVQGW